jgi:FKBP-type peptidyl-prolyl cis-trans isomerase
MIRQLIPAAFALCLTTLAPAQTPADDKASAQPATATEAPADPAAVKADASYVFGFRTGASFAQEYSQYGISAADIEAQAFIKGFIGALKGDKPELSEDKTRAALKSLGDILQKRETELGAKNLEEGKKFLEENAKKPGIITTKSGLQYQILEKGGDKKYLAPKEGDLSNKEFMVNYEGSVINGTPFDSSPPGKPIAMNLEVINGVKEALTNMPIGAKWKIFIPGNLAYGEKRRSGAIGPNQLLIFELELIEIKDAAPAPEDKLSFPQPPADPINPTGE